MCTPVIRAVFLRAYATSLRRPWIKGADSAFRDARYRLSVPFAAPIVALVAMLIVIFRRVSPATLSRKYAALIVCFTLLAAGGGSFITLGKVFDNYLKTPELALEFDQPPSLSEIAFGVFLWLCVAAYCVLVIFL
jgi:hypothetical protein